MAGYRERLRWARTAFWRISKPFRDTVSRRKRWTFYFWAGGDRAFLEQLYAVLEKHDQYLWKVRDSNRDGCLEAWSAGDTGEDHSTKFGDSYHFWSFDFPPTPERVTSLQLAALKRQKVTWQPDSSADRKLESPMPAESMDVMSYSYANRSTLAAISKILGNGREAHWTEQAAKVMRQDQRLPLDPRKEGLLRSRSEWKNHRDTGPQ